jgi:hypothetical protein
MRDVAWRSCAISLMTLSVACSGTSPGSGRHSDSSGHAGSSGANASGGNVSSAGGTSAGGGGASSVGGTEALGGTSAGGTQADGGTSNAGSGGDGGSGGSAPHVVADCDNLPELGTFEDITPPDVTPNNEALAAGVEVHAQVSGTVYASVGAWSGSRGFYRSTDCGANWVKLDSGQNGAQISSGFQWSLAVDPRDGDVIYAVNGYGGPATLFKSTNAGDDWVQLIADDGEVASYLDGNFVQGVSMDPTNPDHLVLTFHVNCKGEYAPACMAESTDAGANWTLFKSPAGGWEEGAAPIVIDEDTILYSSGANSGVYYTTNLGQNWEKVIDTGGGQQLYRSPLDDTYYLGSFGGVHESADGHSWTLIPNSPVTFGLIGTGTNLYTTTQAIKNDQPFYVANEAAPTSWSKVPSQVFAEGGNHLAYDPDHQLLYSSNFQGRLSRARVE